MVEGLLSMGPTTSSINQYTLCNLKSAPGHFNVILLVRNLHLRRGQEGVRHIAVGEDILL